MPFSAVTCLSYTGTTPLGGIINLYSDVDSFVSAFTTNINLSAITGNECPYYINNVPDGTTQIRIFDISTGCYCDIPVQSNNLCVSCDLDFNVYSATTVGRLVAGNLTGDCQANITDYRIFWYETGDTINPVYISGKGTEFTPYSFTHPLTGGSAIFAQAGTYIPVIDKIKLSGLTFSQTGGTGTIPADLECFTATTVTVDAFTCDNGDGSSNDPNYEHRVNFLSAAAGTTPLQLESTFIFTATTDYFAWKFKGFNIPDRLKLTYNGSAYPTPILLEDLVIGDDSIISNFNLNLVPKTADTLSNYYVKKVLCLTGLTRNVGDSLKLEVIPNSANTQTNWDFYFTCLNTFNQNTKLLTSPYKISGSTITMIEEGCNTIRVTFSISGDNKNVDDFTKYIVNDSYDNILNGTNYRDYNIYTTSTPSLINQNTGELYINKTRFETTQPKLTALTCAPPTTNTITYQKYVSGGTQGVIDMTFSNIIDLNTYYNSYLSVNSSISTGLCLGQTVGPWSGTPLTPTDYRYYRRYRLAIPSNTGSTNCGDGTTSKIFNLHPSTIVTTGTSGPNYTLRFTMPTIINGLIYTDPCAFSGTVQVYVNTINVDATGTSNNFTATTITGSKYVDPFYEVLALCSGTTSVTNRDVFGYFDYPKYLNETIPYTGTTPTIVPSLSAITFNFDYPRFTLTNVSNNLGYYRRYGFYYRVTANNPLDYRDFEIYARNFTGGTVPSTYTLIYGYTGATTSSTIYDSSYFI